MNLSELSQAHDPAEMDGFSASEIVPASPEVTAHAEKVGEVAPVVGLLMLDELVAPPANFSQEDPFATASSSYEAALGTQPEFGQDGYDPTAGLDFE